jgi:hypothetical protein
VKRLSVRGRYGVHCTVGAADGTYVGDRVSSVAEVSVAIGVALIHRGGVAGERSYTLRGKSELIAAEVWRRKHTASTDKARKVQ